MKLETERLVLRVPTEDDVDSLAPIFADPEVMTFLVRLTREQLAAHIRAWRGRHEADGFGLLTVVRKEDSCVIGRAGLLVWDTRTWTPSTLAESGEHGEVEIGWTLARDCWGHGYATEAGAASRDYVLNELGRRRVISLIAHGNERSVNVAERLGLAFERDVQTHRGQIVQLFSLTDA